MLILCFGSDVASEEFKGKNAQNSDFQRPQDNYRAYENMMTYLSDLRLYINLLT